MKKFGKVLLLAVWLIAAIESSIAAFNTLETFYIIYSIIHLSACCLGVYYIGKKIFNGEL